MAEERQYAGMRIILLQQSPSLIMWLTAYYVALDRDDDDPAFNHWLPSILHAPSQQVVPVSMKPEFRYLDSRHGEKT
jgi:hypothetical protein